MIFNNMLPHNQGNRTNIILSEKITTSDILKLYNGQLPYNFYYGSAVVYNNEIHILGSSSYGVRTKHYKWNGITWTSVSTLPYNFYYGSAVVYNNEIHIMGGSGGTYVEHYRYVNDWINTSTLPYSFTSGTAVTFNNELYIYGPSGYVYECYKYINGIWKNVGTIPYGMYNSSSVIYNDSIYVLGSLNNYYNWSKLYIGYIGKPTIYCNIEYKIYSNTTINTDDLEHVFDDVDQLIVFVYDKDEKRLLYTNQSIEYNQDTLKYEIYGYFPSTLQKTTVEITDDGWQTLQLGTPILFR